MSTAAAPDLAAQTAAQVPAALRERLGARASRIVLHDVYDQTGGPMYDDLCRQDTQEVPELARALRATRGEVLELAAGAGRLTLPILASGRSITALELSPTMLGLLRTRLDEAPQRLRDRCTVVQSDMRDFELGRRFGAVVLGTTSVSLLDPAGRADLFERVVAHLEPGGLFVLSTLDVRLDGQVAADVCRLVTGASGQRYCLTESLSSDGTHRLVAICRDPESEDLDVDVCVSRVALVPSELLVREMQEHGLRVIDEQTVAGVEDRYQARLLVVSSERGSAPR